MAGTPNWLIMAIMAAVTALFSEGTLECWGNHGGSFGGVKCCETFSGIVEFLDCNTSIGTWYVVAPVAQEAAIVVLQV